jgi:hypothetical protein
MMASLPHASSTHPSASPPAFNASYLFRGANVSSASPLTLHDQGSPPNRMSSLPKRTQINEQTNRWPIFM